jgi:hypothetical protein
MCAFSFLLLNQTSYLNILRLRFTQIYNVRSQFEDVDALGGKILDRDKATVIGALKDALAWIDTHQAAAALEDFNKKLSGQL